MRRRVELSWAVGPCDAADAPPATRVPATVPGAVQLDWAKAEGWGPHWHADNWEQYGGLEDRWWSYVATIPRMELAAGERVCFVARGIDYAGEVRVDGKKVATFEGMFTPVEVDVTEAARVGGELEVRVSPAPKSCATPKDRVQANQSCKPAVSYGWDFHPRLIPLGLWREAYLEVTSRGILWSRPSTHCGVEADLATAVMTSSVMFERGTASRIRWSLLDPDGQRVSTEDQAIGQLAQGATFSLVVDAPHLWWPHDQGASALYTVVAEALDETGQRTDRVERRIGFRRVRLVMNEGAWDEPSTFPKSRSVPPITLEINGRQIFAKGANWVSPDIFPGTITRERLREQLELVRGANMNILRCWGGAPVMPDDFFELCDELGIMVWQEFPLACNRYEGTPEYLEVLDRESTSIITRLREHPSLVLWCGGNELFNSWSRMTDQDAALRLLNRNTFDLDPDRPFLMTSPVMGMGHGHYVFRDSVTGEEAWSIFQNARCTAYTEFGMPSPAPVEVLRKIIPESELFPPKRGTAWETHHAFGVWMAESHLYQSVIEHYFGKSETLEQLVEHGNLLQSEGYRGLFEEARRQKPYASMALNWCLNEPWPTAANNSLIAWPCVAKPALRAVGEACRPTLASARIRKFDWKAGELFDPELWILNDAPSGLSAGRVRASMRCGELEMALLTWEFPAMPANTNAQGPRAQVRLPTMTGQTLELVLQVDGQPELNSTYTLVYRPSGTALSGGGTRTMNL